MPDCPVSTTVQNCRILDEYDICKPRTDQKELSRGLSAIRLHQLGQTYFTSLDIESQLIRIWFYDFSLAAAENSWRAFNSTGSSAA